MKAPERRIWASRTNALATSWRCGLLFLWRLVFSSLDAYFFLPVLLSLCRDSGDLPHDSVSSAQTGLWSVVLSPVSRTLPSALRWSIIVDGWMNAPEGRYLPGCMIFVCLFICWIGLLARSLWSTVLGNPMSDTSLAWAARPGAGGREWFMLANFLGLLAGFSSP